MSVDNVVFNTNVILLRCRSVKSEIKFGKLTDQINKYMASTCTNCNCITIHIQKYYFLKMLYGQ